MPATRAGRPRTKPAEERRDDLLISAQRLFLEKGVEQTTIEDITQGASVAKGTFYLQFQSKADVIEALRSRFVQNVLNRIRTEVLGQDDDLWHGKLSAWMRACAIGYLEAERLHRLIFEAAPRAHRDGLVRNPLIDDLTALLADGVVAKACSISDPAFTAIFLFNALHGVVGNVQFDPSSTGRDSLLMRIDDHVQRLIR